MYKYTFHTVEGLVVVGLRVNGEHVGKFVEVGFSEGARDVGLGDIGVEVGENVVGRPDDGVALM
eukprot:1381698-Amorphochlora_amoeboformis.AAC.1